MKKFILFTLLIFAVNPAWAAFWQIGDDDGYGVGIPDNTNHPFDGVCPNCANVDNRSAAEASATDGAQYTDTYSTTHPGFSPQAGTVATFVFSGLGNGWTQGSMWYDMADFQASTFGAVITTYNGINQNWAFNDGYPSTKIHFFDLGQDVLDSINLLGYLEIKIDRNASNDFYGFDYALLSDRVGDTGNPLNPVPEPPLYALLAAGWLIAFSPKKRISA